MLFVLSLFCSLTACADKDRVDYSIEGTQEVQAEQEYGGKKGLEQFQGEANWKDSFLIIVGESEWQGQKGFLGMDVKIDARIILPEADEMHVIEVTETVLNEELKQRVAENIFGEEEIFYGDVSHLPKQELLEIQALYDNDLSKVEDKEVYEALKRIEDAKETYTPVTEYTVNEYIGDYNGRMYCLYFEKNPVTYNPIININKYCRSNQIVFKVKDLREVCPEEYKEQEQFHVCSPWMRGAWMENPCKISEEEAWKIAEEFVEQLGLNYPVASYVRPMLWGIPPSSLLAANPETAVNWGIYGYVCYFDIGLENLSFVSYGTEEDYSRFWEHADKKEQYSMKAQMQVYVTEEGVIQMIADNPVETAYVSGGVELLPLDTIKTILKQELDARGEFFQLDHTVDEFNEMELLYFRVSDEENPGNYSYVPTWRLSNVQREIAPHRNVITNPVLINAIDGSVIDFYNET